MNLQRLWTLARKDWADAFKNTSVVVPMIVLPAIFVVLFPVLFIVVPAFSPQIGQSLASDPDIQPLLNNLPEFLLPFTQGLDVQRTVIVLMLGLMLSPMFLILPLMTSTVIAADSFAGERERKTIEALLYTPASDRELFFGKVLAALVPAVLLTWGSFLVYTLVVNLASYWTMGWVWFPLPTWYPLIFWISPALSLLGVAFTVWISARNPTFMGAYQMSGVLVVLVLPLLFGQIAGVVYLTVEVGLLAGAVIWAVALGLTRFVARGFNRQRLLAGL
ncbi:ABC transporter permease subunit [Anaerolinea sp.]|uniref:ABC transporter permease subunit n=1 Tax=Anaerolinea sp. TaxID=1872519 RepID=UPI002ACD853E|nr:ABC transporter permease subunit [Anaerolinea sp.]